MGFFSGPTLGLFASEIRGEDVRFWAIYLGAVVLIGAGGFMWAAFIRKSRKRRRKIRRPHTWQLSPDEHRSAKSRGKHRRSKHVESPMNPTLADTGGLPSKRPEEEPPDSAT